MPKLYPHMTNSLIPAVQANHIILEQQPLLYLSLNDYLGLNDESEDLPLPNYDYQTQRFEDEIRFLLRKYEELVNIQTTWPQDLIKESLLKIQQFEKNFFNLQEGGYYEFRKKNEAQTFKYIKTLLERNYLLLISRCMQQPNEGAQILKECLYEFNACASGAIGHFSSIENRLNSNQNIAFWLAQDRTSLPLRYLSINADKNFPYIQNQQSVDIHAQIELENHSLKVGLNILKKPINDLIHIKKSADWYINYYSFVVNNYDESSIIDCVTSNFAQMIKTFHEKFVNDDEGWIDVTPPETRADVESQVETMAKAIKVDKEPMLTMYDFLEYTQDYRKIRLKKILTENLREFCKNHLLNAGVLTPDKSQALNVNTLKQRNVQCSVVSGQGPNIIYQRHVNNNQSLRFWETASIVTAAGSFIGTVIAGTFSRAVASLFTPLASTFATQRFLQMLGAAIVVTPTVMLLNLLAHLSAFVFKRYAKSTYKPGYVSDSIEEKQAFEAGTKAQVSFKYELTTFYNLSTYKHPLAYYAGMQAKLVEDKDLIAKMRPQA